MKRFWNWLLDTLLGHDWDMEFPYKDRPLDWRFTCRRCGKVTYDQPQL